LFEKEQFPALIPQVFLSPRGCAREIAMLSLGDITAIAIDNLLVMKLVNEK